MFERYGAGYDCIMLNPLLPVSTVYPPARFKGEEEEASSGSTAGMTQREKYPLPKWSQKRTSRGTIKNDWGDDAMEAWNTYSGSVYVDRKLDEKNDHKVDKALRLFWKRELQERNGNSEILMDADTSASDKEKPFVIGIFENGPDAKKKNDQVFADYWSKASEKQKEYYRKLGFDVQKVLEPIDLAQVEEEEQQAEEETEEDGEAEENGQPNVVTGPPAGDQGIHAKQTEEVDDDSSSSSSSSTDDEEEEERNHNRVLEEENRIQQKNQSEKRIVTRNHKRAAPGAGVGTGNSRRQRTK